MMKFMRYSTMLLFLITLPIGLFYGPNLPTYVLGDIREGLVNGWLFLHTTVVIGLGIVTAILFKTENVSSWLTGILVLFLIGLILLHGLPSLIYWDLFHSGHLIIDNAGNIPTKASLPIFVWHLLIVTGSFIILSVKLISTFRYVGVKGECMRQKYRIRYFFEYGGGVLWSADDHAIATYGYLIDPHKLPISSGLLSELERLEQWFQSSLNWDYPPDPSPWSSEEREKFIEASDKLFFDMYQELGQEFELIDERNLGNLR